MKKSNLHPIAYFITMRAYGTWLHGDSRSSVDRINNIYGTPTIKSNQRFEAHMSEALSCQPMHFNTSKRDIIKLALMNACDRYEWKLFALHVRSNHVHIVLQSDHIVNDVVKALKARATLFLRKCSEIREEQQVWSRHASTKYIWTECALHYACQYTIHEQGEKMAYVDNLCCEQ